jgi:hypothetical protein
MAKKKAGKGALVIQLKPEEAKTVLLRLLDAEPQLRDKVEDLIRELLSEVDAEDVAADIEFELDGLDLDDLNAASGEASGRYVGPDEAAWNLIREAVEPYLDDLKRRRASGRRKEAVEICKGIVLGLYHAEKNDATSWAPDAPLELAREAVEALGPSLLPRGFSAEAVPKWAADLGGRRAK